MALLWHIFISLLLFSSILQAAEWKLERVSKASAGNRKVALVTDKANRPHLLYTGCTDQICKESMLEYAVKNEQGAWQTRIIDDYKKKTGWFASAVVDHRGELHVTYSDPHPKMRLKHAHVSAASAFTDKWAIDSVGELPGGYWNSLQVHGNDLFLSTTSFVDGNLDKSVLQFGRMNADRWQFATLDQSVEAGWLTSLALAADGRAAISYVRSSYPAGRMVVRFQDPAMSWQEVELDVRSVKSTLAIDSEGVIHVLYQRYKKEDNEDARELVYARIAQDRSILEQTVIDGNADLLDDTGSHPHMLIDQSGNLHAVYSCNRYLRLMYASKLKGQSTWNIAPVTAKKSDGYYAHLALDRDGRLHVAYDTGREIHYGFCVDCSR